MQNNAPTRPRYRFIDTVRGICVINMVLYHLMYDLVYMYDISAPWYNSAAGYIWQQLICRCFILLAGMSLCLSRHPLRRGVVISACGIIITAVTAIIMPDEAIYFGILTMIGASYIIMSLLSRVLKKIPPAAGLIICTLLFAVTRNVPRGAIGFDEIALLRLPESLYSVPGFAFLGFPSIGFSSSDYFPLIPWIFIFACGYYIWKLLSKNAVFLRLMSKGIRFFELIGRHALIIYMLHQIVLFAVLYIIFRIIR